MQECNCRGQNEKAVNFVSYFVSYFFFFVSVFTYFNFISKLILGQLYGAWGQGPCDLFQAPSTNPKFLLISLK